MSRILIIGDDCHLSDEIGAALKAVDLPLEYAAGHAEALGQLRVQPFSVVITSCESDVEHDLALLAEMRSIQPG
jgi:DNA-binding NtrC family response regulator